MYAVPSIPVVGAEACTLIDERTVRCSCAAAKCHGAIFVDDDEVADGDAPSVRLYVRDRYDKQESIVLDANARARLAWMLTFPGVAPRATVDQGDVERELLKGLVLGRFGSDPPPSIQKAVALLTGALAVESDPVLCDAGPVVYRRSPGV